MDDESKTNGVAESEKVSKKAVEGEVKGPAKDSLKLPKRKRSRSQTPQSNSDDTKSLHSQIKKKADEKNDNMLTEEKEETVKEGDTTRSTRSKTQKEKEEPATTDGDGKGEKSKESSKKDDTVKKEATKEEKTSQKDTTPKKSSSDNKKESPSSKKEAKQDSALRREEKQRESTPKKENLKKESTPSPKKEAATKKDTPKKETNGVDSDSVEMDPLLIMPDESEPELLFDDNSDMESGKGSPSVPRCLTRRSLTRNIPTPRTPKSMETDIDSEIAFSITEPETNIDYEDNELMDTTNMSTKAEAGSDITRLEYADIEVLTGHDDSYLDISRERSLSETLRSLSARRPIRSTGNVRMRVLRSAQERSDLNLSESHSGGVKRKDRSTSPDGVKKFKPDSDSTGYSLLSSPFASLKSRFSRTEVTSSTPKLMGYKDNANDLHCDGEYENVHGDDEKKNWCSIM